MQHINQKPFLKIAGSNRSTIRLQPNAASASNASRPIVNIRLSLKPNLGASSRLPSTKNRVDEVFRVSFHANISSVTV